MMYYCIGVWMYVLSKLSRIIVKRTNFNLETFSMFNIIKTLQNYFTGELLPYKLSSEWHFTST